MRKFPLLILLAIFQFQQALPVYEEVKRRTHPSLDSTTRFIRSTQNKCCEEFPTCCIIRGRKRDEEDASVRMRAMFLKKSVDEARLENDITIQQSIRSLLDATKDNRNYVMEDESPIESLSRHQNQQDNVNTGFESTDLRSTLRQSISLIKREQLKENLQLLLNNLRKTEDI
jgi:hypothetical protein